MGVVLLFRIRPDLCWVGLFSLNFRHLSQRMLFARCRKQEDAERNGDNALSKERTHNALAQLSVSAAMRKDEKAQCQGVTAGRAESFDHDYDHEQEQEQE